jgi:lipopolysaccharide/colanic/teichoic acid biosynthesis glycosyltransferase
MYKKFLKRFFDFGVTLVALLCISPIFAIAVILLTITNRGEIFFTQQRPGKHGKIFQIYKFKSMTDDVDEKGELLPNEQRITPVGSFIRKTSIDELPQLINVLIGDMSLVGPRPLPVRYLDLYTKEQKKRHQVRPGITGWAQVNGRNQISWTKKFELDVWYTEHISFLLDIKILFMTIFKILKTSGINSDNKIGAEGFNGYN